MPKRKESQQRSEPSAQEPFVTIDDCIQSARELFSRLSRLGEYKHPLEVRKGVTVPMAAQNVSKTIKAASRTYFFDLRKTKDGKPYLVITESRLKENQRSQITIFGEEARAFLDATREMIEAIEEK